MTEISLAKPDTFSPFGITIAQDKNNVSRIYLSDHGSSRLIVSNLTSELENYTSYWTSPSRAYPASLPSQVISDKFGNIYLPQHGGNKISRISVDTGLMTEFDIPTGPLATVVYAAVSPDASKLWFTEWASNRIAYLDNMIAVPLGLKNRDISKLSPIILKINENYPLDMLVTKEPTSTPLLSLNQVELSVVGMTDSSLHGLTYVANPQRVNMSGISNTNASINLELNPEDAIAGKYIIMTRLSTVERDNLTISILSPQLVTVDVPILKSQLQNLQTSQSNGESATTFILLRDIARFASVGVAVTLIGYLVYRKFGKGRHKRET
jgi:hypothetical protein